MTGQDVINEALLLLRRITPGQTASGDETATCQLELNALLDAWNAMGIAIYSVAPQLFSLTSGVGSYTIGTGATFNTNRPVKIEAWNVRTSSGQANGGVPLDAAAFALVAVDRSAQGSRVKAVNYDAAYPTGSVHLYPIPSGGSIELWTWDALPQISNFTSALAYPPGYLEAIVYNLAVALAPKFATRAPLDQAVVQKAAEMKSALGNTNSSQHPVTPPAGAPQ